MRRIERPSLQGRSIAGPQAAHTATLPLDNGDSRQRCLLSAPGPDARGGLKRQICSGAQGPRRSPHWLACAADSRWRGPGRPQGHGGRRERTGPPGSECAGQARPHEGRGSGLAGHERRLRCHARCDQRPSRTVRRAPTASPGRSISDVDRVSVVLAGPWRILGRLASKHVMRCVDDRLTLVRRSLWAIFLGLFLGSVVAFAFDDHRLRSGRPWFLARVWGSPSPSAAGAGPASPRSHQPASQATSIATIRRPPAQFQAAAVRSSPAPSRRARSGSTRSCAAQSRSVDGCLESDRCLLCGSHHIRGHPWDPVAE